MAEISGPPISALPEKVTSGTPLTETPNKATPSKAGASDNVNAPPAQKATPTPPKVPAQGTTATPPAKATGQAPAQDPAKPTTKTPTGQATPPPAQAQTQTPEKTPPVPAPVPAPAPAQAPTQAASNNTTPSPAPKPAATSPATTTTTTTTTASAPPQAQASTGNATPSHPTGVPTSPPTHDPTPPRNPSPKTAPGRPNSGQRQRGHPQQAATASHSQRRNSKSPAATGRRTTNSEVPPLDKTDVIIQKLLAVRANKQGKQVLVLLKEDEIRHVQARTREILMSQPTLLELDGPIKVAGDIHGQYYDLLRLFDRGGFPPEANYLFLGDYVDRGKHSMEVICLLFCYKIKYPENFFLLRGNHESAAINRMYGFYDDCKRRYNVKLWKGFTDVFNCLPAAATIGEKILCMHGGISPDLSDLRHIRDVTRPTEVPDQGLLCDLLWADPEFDIEGWTESDRGVSYLFGQNEVTRFLNLMDMDLIIRAHQVMERGYEFFADRQLVTLFSAPNYCAEFDNDAAIMNIDENLQCSFAIIPAIIKGPRTFL